MKHLIKVGLLAALIAGCSDGDGDRAMVVPPTNPVDPPPVEPPVEPPVTPPAPVSFAGFVRDVLNDDENATPREVQDVQFNQDATQDDFADLF